MIESQFSKVKDYYILNKSSSEFSFDPFDEMVSGYEMIQLAIFHSSLTVVFISLEDDCYYYHTVRI